MHFLESTLWKIKQVNLYKIILEKIKFKNKKACLENSDCNSKGSCINYVCNCKTGYNG